SVSRPSPSDVSISLCIRRIFPRRVRAAARRDAASPRVPGGWGGGARIVPTRVGDQAADPVGGRS
ncbi:hypothetical protein MXD58_014055, partial [Frankia sp. AgKG'84/4]